MFEIIKTQIGSSEVNAVSARELHTKLECESKFADWVKRRIDKYDFVEGTDFIVLKNENGESSRFQQIEYFITIEMAEELGITANKVGRITNQLGLKTEAFAECRLDKAAHSNKQVESWYYRPEAVEQIKTFLKN